MLRLFDTCLAAVGLIVLSPLLLVLFLVGLWDTGSPLFKQARVGKGLRHFTLVKFRTMRPDTASVATHLADASAITPFGRFLRRSKLDELPQLWNVLKGEMSLVGPRPCLPNQIDVIEARTRHRIFEVRPGITGLAQINGIDMSTPELLAETDAQMVNTLSVTAYLRCILLTVSGSGAGDRVKEKSD